MTFTSTYDLDEFGSETSLSQSSGVQRGASLIGLAGGTSAVFYHDVATGEIAARLVAANGTPGARVVASSGSIDFSLSSAGHPEPVSVAKLTNGNIVLTWASNEPTKNVYYRIFDANLNPLTGAVLAETSSVEGIRPDVAALAGGGFVIVWEKVSSASLSYPAYRRFDASGGILDGGVGVPLDPTGSVLGEAPSVAGLADGGFAVGWNRRDAATGDTEVWYAVRNADGTVRVAATLQDTTGTLNRDVDVVARSDGGFSLFYEDNGWADPDTEITAANFNAAGNFQHYRRMTSDTNSSSEAAAAVSSEGFVLVTQTFSYANFPDITGSLMAPDGTVVNTDIALAITGENQVSGLAWLDAATVRVTYRGGGQTLGDDGTSVNSRTFHLIRTTTGDAANDVIDFSASAVWNVVYGGDGDDVITGGAGDDTLFGDNNNDTLNGGDGNDYLKGGFGINILNGGAGNDQLESGLGTSTMNGGTGNDFLRIDASGSSVDGGADTDILNVYGSVSVAALSGIESIQLSNATLTLTASQLKAGMLFNGTISGAGQLIINMATTDVEIAFNTYTTSGITATINGSTASEVIKGFQGIVNTINGGDGDDQIRGANQADFINGGTGNDRIYGAGGADILTGGAGADVFRYQFANASGVGAAADRITDFVIGSDRIGLAQIDADLVTPGDQAFSFIGTGAFANTGLGQVRYQNSGADLLVQIDSDGNGVVDMEIVLQGLFGQPLTGASFNL